jgi:SynChlorMet cassette protein ScmD
MGDDNQIDIHGSSIIQTKPGVVLQEEEDNWGLLHDPERDLNCGLNPVSVFIWKSLKNRQTVDEIVTKVKKHFSPVPDEVEEDAIQFLNDLVKNGLAFPDSQ